MQSKDLLLLANQQAPAMVLPLLEDLATAPLTTGAGADGNHAHWILGHLALSETGFRSMADGTPNAAESLKPMFGGGSQPQPAGDGYPAYADLLTQLKARHEETVAWIESLSEDDLDQKSQAIPEGFEPFFGTWRQVLLMRPLHYMNHRGQLADCRRAAGREPMMA